MRKKVKDAILALRQQSTLKHRLTRIAAILAILAILGLAVVACSSSANAAGGPSDDSSTGVTVTSGALSAQTDASGVTISANDGDLTICVNGQSFQAWIDSSGRLVIDGDDTTLTVNPRNETTQVDTNGYGTYTLSVTDDGGINVNTNDGQIITGAGGSQEGFSFNVDSNWNIVVSTANMAFAVNASSRTFTASMGDKTVKVSVDPQYQDDQGWSQNNQYGYSGTTSYDSNYGYSQGYDHGQYWVQLGYAPDNTYGFCRGFVDTINGFDSSFNYGTFGYAYDDQYHAGVIRGGDDVITGNTTDTQFVMNWCRGVYQAYRDAGYSSASWSAVYGSAGS